MAGPADGALIGLCERVLAATMEPEELQREWPDEPSDPELAELRATLLDAIEHRLGDVVDGQWTADPAASRSVIPEYDDVAVHLERLRRAAHS